ncbi:hypothetical protein R80B4_02834 [Fibrobacteres bacterium R8-0-B4]
MAIQIILAVGMLALLFILFLVISRSVGNIDNLLYKLEYLVRKDCDIRLETLEAQFRQRAADKRFEEKYGPRFDEVVDEATRAIGGEIEEKKEGKKEEKKEEKKGGKADGAG